MADDDEVDVLGDFSLDSLFPKEDSRLHCYDAGVLGAQSSDLLNDYIAPQWLLDTTQPWYPADDKSRGTNDRLMPEERQHTFGFSSLTGVESPTKNAPGTSRWEESDLGWTEREKSLLEKGMEMFGKSWNKISQLIGTKTGSQVKNYVKWERNCRSDESIVTEVNPSSNFDQQPGEVFSFSEIIDDMQIPASMEEVIAVVSTASPTIPVTLPRTGENRDKKKDSLKGQAWNGKNSIGKKQEHHRSFEEKKRREKKRKSVVSMTSDGKLKQTPDKYDVATAKKRDTKLKNISGKHEQIGMEDECSLPLVFKSHPKLPDKLSCGEEVVRMTREGSESNDSEIEVGDNEPVMLENNCGEAEGTISQLSSVLPKFCMTSEVEADDPPGDSFTSPMLENFKEEEDKNDELMPIVFEDGSKSLPTKLTPAVTIKDRRDKHSCHQDIMDSIAAIAPPTAEFFPDMQSISEQEKLIHTEFFEGRSTKTPKRYMKIRNHILECWYNSRPQYVTKTSVRTGLRNCGDVNCIGRIHAYLEQIGAINFGCEQARYLRPHVPTSPTSNSCLIDGEESADVHRGPTREEISARHQARIVAMRPRKRKGMDLATSLEGIDGGYTIIHGGTVDGVEQSDEEIIVFTKGHTTSKKSNFSGRCKNGSGESKLKLVCCSTYSNEQPAPFVLELCLEALLVVDFHAHLMHTEVAGLLGGYSRTNSMAAVEEEKFQETLRVCRAVPCRSAGSNTGCDICPVSQTEAMEILDQEGLELVGWYHSHPTFPPLPSMQDIETQTHAQEWFMRSRGSPFLGIILSPHTVQKDSAASSVRCIVVETNQESKEEAPYELEYKVIGFEGSEPCLSNLRSVLSVINQESSSGEVDLDSLTTSPLQQPLTLREKILQSANTFMARSLPQPACSIQEDIVAGLQRLLIDMKNHLSVENA